MQIILCPGIPQLKHIEFEACLSMEEKRRSGTTFSGFWHLIMTRTSGPPAAQLMTKQCHADLVDGSYIRFKVKKSVHRHL